MNLSEAFSFEEQEKLAGDSELLGMKTLPPTDILATTDSHTAAEVDAPGDGTASPQTGQVVNPS